jgi:transglutaminase-like putative cysteine protease
MRQTKDHSLTPFLQFKLYLLTGLVLLPHIANLPLAVTIFLFATLGLRFLSLKFPQLQPGRWILFFLTLAGIFLIYNQHQGILGKDAGTSLLSIMLILKTLEVRRRRDLYVTVFIAYFVIVTQFLYDQTILLLIFLTLIMIGHTSLLLETNRVSPSKNMLEPFRQTFTYTLQALPIAIILFIMFPRLSQPLWTFGFEGSGLTGISKEIRPGSISQLIQSDDVAFRVTFKDKAPPRINHYWRGLVLWDTDGTTWSTDENRPIPMLTSQVKPTGEPIEYEIMLEPHKKNWLFTLDLPVLIPKDSKLSVDFSLYTLKPVVRPKQYEAISYSGHKAGTLTSESRKRALQLADNVTDRQRNLVARWRTTSENNSALVQKALKYFNSESFIYTLNPPSYTNNPIDQFLFNEREGFCEHYATAFTQLMRLADIPARIVIGYQGGEYNQLGGYYTIRQYDAHAWTEVWLEDHGWQRIDPTAAVAPERVRSAIQPNVGSVGSPVVFRIDDNSIIGKSLKQLGMLLDNTGLQWRLWVLGFDQDRQFSIMRRLGLDFLTAGYWGLIIVGAITLFLAIVTLSLLRKGQIPQDPLNIIYRDFCEKLRAVGIDRQAHEGPMDFSNRVVANRPDLAEQVKQITHDYIRLRYSNDIKPLLEDFARRVKQFKPKK